MNGAPYWKFKKKIIFELLLVQKKPVIPVTILCNWLEDLLNSILFDLNLGKINENTRPVLASTSY